MTVDLYNRMKCSIQSANSPIRIHIGIRMGKLFCLLQSFSVTEWFAFEAKVCVIHRSTVFILKSNCFVEGKKVIQIATHHSI